jgi:hypothetical protein
VANRANRIGIASARHCASTNRSLHPVSKHSSLSSWNLLMRKLANSCQMQDAHHAPRPPLHRPECCNAQQLEMRGIAHGYRLPRNKPLRRKKRLQFEAITANTKRLFRCSAVSRNERHFVIGCRDPALQRPGFSSCVHRVMLTWCRGSEIRSSSRRDIQANF